MVHVYAIFAVPIHFSVQQIETRFLSILIFHTSGCCDRSSYDTNHNKIHYLETASGEIIESVDILQLVSLQHIAGAGFN